MWKPEDVDPFSDEPQPEIAVVRAGEDLDWEVVESFFAGLVAARDRHCWKI